MAQSHDVLDRIREYLDSTGQRHKAVAIIPGELMYEAMEEAESRMEALGGLSPPGELLVLDGVTKLLGVQQACRYAERYFEICRLVR
jgi:hypothetical protein